MKDLIARLEAAEVESTGFNDDVLRSLGFVTKRYPMDSDTYWIVPGNERHPLPPWCDKITISIDAALALAERVLPGFTWRVQRHSSGMFDAAFWSDPDDQYAGYGRVVSPAVAICLAILRAKLAEEPIKG